MIDKLTPDEIEEYQEAFKQFDIGNKGYITTKDLQKVLNTLGYNPSEKELEEIINEVDKNGNDTLEFQEFLILMAKKTSEYDIEEELIEALKVLDYDNKSILSAQNFKKIMQNNGNKMNASELELIMACAEIDANGNFDYQKFIKSLIMK